MPSPAEQQSQPQVDANGGPAPQGFDEEFESRRSRARRWLLFLVLTPVLGFAVIFYFHGSTLSSKALVMRAEEKYAAGDVQGAQADLDAAADWAPEMPEIYELRCQIRMQAGDLEGAEADANKLIELSPEYADGYKLRSQVYQRQTFADPQVDRHREAVDDLVKAQKLSSIREPMPYNNLAYARALAGIELQAGLEDAQRAIELLDKQASQVLPDSPAKVSLDNSRAAVLDTRGYLQHLLGNDELALKDLNEAIALTESSSAEMVKLVKARNLGEVVLARFEESRDHTLSVLHQHRGAIHQKLGHQQEAAADFAKAKQLGFDPQGGVF